MEAKPQCDGFSAWNPGVESDIPVAYRELETIYDPAHVFSTFEEVQQLVTDTGLSALELISFRPQRLVLHELIARITADIVVVEGEAEEDLGINFRELALRISERYVQPELARIEGLYDDLCQQLEELVWRELEAGLQRLNPPQPPPQTFWQRLLGSKPSPPPDLGSREERTFQLIADYKTRGLNTSDETEAAVLRSLARVLDTIANRRGFIGNDLDYLARICLRHVVNYLGSRRIGREVGSLINKAVEAEGYQRIPDADKPVLFSLKGASASGKSHLRPMLRSKMATLGIGEDSYGTISPDIWRKLLLDYDSLGAAYKYAGRFTSHEVSVIDAKLDRYIRAKAERNQSIPHLVVDRFRFDSFASEKVGRVLHKTYVRYIDTLYMYFIITPPESTVERGWQRGLERGRYKAVEDYLGHCVEAYEGMPKLLFKWLANETPRYSFKFMDNSGAKEELPTMIARGTQGWMQIYQPDRFIDIQRYQRINIGAKTPREVAAPPIQLTVKNNIGFLRQCIDRIRRIEFVDAASEQAYLLIESGKFKILDRPVFERKLGEGSQREILAELAPDLPID